MSPDNGQGRGEVLVGFAAAMAVCAPLLWIILWSCGVRF